jgi:hypothetical protein
LAVVGQMMQTMTAGGPGTYDQAGTTVVPHHLAGQMGQLQLAAGSVRNCMIVFLITIVIVRIL